MKRLFVLGTLVLSFVFQASAQANVGEAYGFGSRTAALAGAGVAWGAQAYGSYHNPAGLSVEQEKRLLFSWGLLYMQPSFRPITGVVTQNRVTGDGLQTGDVDTSTSDTGYRNTLGQSLGLAYRVTPEFLNLTVGLTTFMPLNQLAYMDSGENFIPEYVLYRARTQRPQVELGVGGDLGKGFHVGVGLHFAFTLTSKANLFINTNSNTSVSTMRFTSSIKPKLSPYLGFLYAPESNPRSLSLGTVFRFATVSDNTMVLNSAARVFGDFAAVDFTFQALSALFYDPATLEVGGSWQHSSAGRFYAQLDYQIWTAFQAPALIIQQPSTTNCRTTTGVPCSTVSIAPGTFPPLSLVNVWIPRIGEEWSLNDVTTIRLGYAYRPSFLKDPPNEAGNYLDPSKHMIHLGLGLNYRKFLNFDSPCQIDFHLAYHYLVLQKITKSPGNEKGDTSDSKIGAPGYDAGGNIFGGGVSLSLAF